MEFKFKLLILLILTITLVGCVHREEISTDEPQYELEVESITNSPKFLKISNNLLEEEEYRRHFYDCDNMSIELVRRLKDAGYNASVVYGKVNNTPHAYVHITDIYIEATNGNEIDPFELEQRYINNYEDDLEDRTQIETNKENIKLLLKSHHTLIEQILLRDTQIK